MTTTVEQSSFNTEKAELFAGELLTTLNHGALCLMVSVGHRTGLFDAMREMAPASIEEISQQTGLNERYVREWLGAMVTSGVIEVDADSHRYVLPAEHAGVLTRVAAADNMAVFAQYIAVLGQVEDEIVECFRRGGGVPYDKFPRFHAVMMEDSGQSVLPALDSHILPLIPGLADQLSRGIQVLDVGCGSGRVMNALAERYPRSCFHGIDLSAEAIATAQAEASAKNLGNIRFTVRDLSDFDQADEPERYDWITTFDSIHDQAKPLNVLRGIHRALRGEGVYLMQEIRGSSHVHENIGHPLGTLLYTVSTMHCMTVSLAQGGEGLGAMWGEEKTQDYLKQAGFRSVIPNQLEHDIQNTWYVVQK